MQGLMSSYPLTLTHVFDRAERIFPEKKVATVQVGGIDRITYGEWAARTRRLAGVLDALEISGSGLTAERLRMNVVAENLANAQTTRGPDGQPYRRKEVVLAERQAEGSFGAALAGAMNGKPGGVEVAAIAEDQTPLKQVYDPSHPDADANGYVRYPSVRVSDEMIALIDARRIYEANATVFQSAKAMLKAAINI